MAVSNIGTLLLLAITLASANWVIAQECQSSLVGLITQCAQYVQIPGPPVAPSQSCCDVIKLADVPCVCKKVTPEVEKMISMEKVAYVAKSCGRPLQSGMHCGSYTVPAGAMN